MRNNRHEAILALIADNNIETQQDLTLALANVGYDVTQATVSRDIKELRLVKRLNENGRYVYVRNMPPKEDDTAEKMSIIFKKSILSADCAANIIVLKTLSGMAQGAAAALDSMHNPEFLGSIAGDDTIFIVARNEDTAKKFCKKLRNMFGHR